MLPLPTRTMLQTPTRALLRASKKSRCPLEIIAFNRAQCYSGPGRFKKFMRDEAAIEKLSARYPRSKGEPLDVGIIGGGISGLAAAIRLAMREEQDRPVKITIYESHDRLGGWLQTKAVPVEGGGQVMFETGPRTLRIGSASSFNTIHLLVMLGLENELRFIPKTSPAARRRYIYRHNNPPHRRMFLLPSNLREVIEQLPFNWDAFASLFHTGIKLLLRKLYPRSKQIAEEQRLALGPALTKVFNKGIVDIFASSVVHGIFAGDVCKLSQKSVYDMFAQTWHWTVEESMAFIETWAPDIPTGVLGACLFESSVFTLEGGMKELVDRLETLLRLAGVSIKLKTKVNNVKYLNNQEGIAVDYYESAREMSSHQVHTDVISTIYAKKLAQIVPYPIKELEESEAVTVIVVNLFYKDLSLSDLCPGFGVLIPTEGSTPTMEKQKDPSSPLALGCLGVIFDSWSTPTIKGDTIQGSKYTVMLGGHWLDSVYPNPSIDQKQTYLDAAIKSVQAVHSAFPDKQSAFSTPDASNVSIQSECIPQPLLGHEYRMANLAIELLQHFSGRLKVAGSSYTGVSVHDCIMSGMDAAQETLEAIPLGLDPFTSTHPASGRVPYLGQKSKAYARVDGHRELMADLEKFRRNMTSKLKGKG